MARSYGQTIGGIQFLGQLAERVNGLEHSRHLLLGGRAAARDALFDAGGGVFKDGQMVGQCYAHGHALCSSQLQHGLNILAKKRRFKGHYFRLVPRNPYADGFVDVCQSF